MAKFSVTLDTEAKTFVATLDGTVLDPKEFSIGCYEYCDGMTDYYVSFTQEEGGLSVNRYFSYDKEKDELVAVDLSAKIAAEIAKTVKMAVSARKVSEHLLKKCTVKE